MGTRPLPPPGAPDENKILVTINLADDVTGQVKVENISAISQIC